jgi:regulator of sigma E protease
MVKHFLRRLWCYLAAILILSGVVAIHEGGHWIAAELNGAHCKTFNIGFGPIDSCYVDP